MAAIRFFVVCGTIPLTMVFPMALTLADSAAPTDSDVVFCLAAAQRTQLADAAVALKMASPGKRPGQVAFTTDHIATEVPVERWRELRPDDFNRACAALASARPAIAETGKGGELGSTLLGLVPVAFGALLAGVTAAISGWRKDRTTDRRALAADLTSAVRLLRNSTDRFLASGAAPPDQVPARAALQQAWADTLAAVRRLTVTHPGRAQPSELERLLTDPDFRRDMNLDWHTSTQDRVARADRLRASVDRMELLATRIASALQRRTGRFGRLPADPDQAAIE